MTDEHVKVATEIANMTRDLNTKFQQAEKLGLHVVAKINESINLESHRSDKRVRIEVALLQPITPQLELGDKK